MIDCSNNKEDGGRSFCRPSLLPTPTRELEYRIPRLHSPVDSRRFPEIFGDFCKNKTSFL